MRLAERLREELGKLLVITTDGTIHFTVSIGLASIQSYDTSIEEVMRRADRALYEAKDRGRSCVVSAEDVKG